MAGSEDESLRKLFLGGLDREKTLEPQLREYFGVYGVVADCVVIRDASKGSKGFGFVTMATVGETDQVLLDKGEDEHHVINGKKVEVKRAIPRGRDILADPIKKLFVAGFKDTNICEDDLKSYFSDCCSVENVHIVKDKETGKSKGYGFIELSNRHMVDKAAIIENHEINNVKIVAKKAMPKGDEMGGGRGGGRRGGRGRGYGGGGYGGGGFGGGGGYGGGDGYGGGQYSMDSTDSYGGYGGDRYSGGRGGGRGGRGGYGGRGGGYGGGSGSSWGGNGYDNWGSGGGGYDAGSNYAGSSSNYGPMKGGYGSGGGGYGGGGYGGGGYGGGGGGGSYGGGKGRPY